MQTFIGIEIGGTKLQLVLGDASGKIIERRKFAVQPDKGASGIREQIEGGLPELIRGGKPESIGVGFGGPVDWRSGKICRSHHVEGWTEFNLAQWLKNLTGVRAVVDNDANVAALGEAGHGAGKGFDPVFYVTLGSGVGGGLITNGRIYHGATPGEAEIGHVRIDRQGTIVEACCSGWAIDSKIRSAKTLAPDGLLAGLVGEAAGGEARHLAAALFKQDAAAKRIFQQLTEDLAFGLSHVVHLLHPEVIVLGGGLASIGEPLRAAVNQALLTHVMEAFAPTVKVALTALGEDAVPIGALELAKIR